MAFPRDLVVLVPDGAIFMVVGALLEKRRASLGLRPVAFDRIKDALHDSSPEATAVTLLRGYRATHERALVLRDLEGSGWEHRGAPALESALTQALNAAGWPADRVAAVVIQPEIEQWLRLGSTHLEALVKAQARRRPALPEGAFPSVVQAAVAAHGGWTQRKPRRPKECFGAVLEAYGVPRSNALYGRLAEKESLSDCAVPSFRRFREYLRSWFAESGRAELAS